jgi:hypothetical protein
MPTSNFSVRNFIESAGEKFNSFNLSNPTLMKTPSSVNVLTAVLSQPANAWIWRRWLRQKTLAKSSF